ncbi:MAG: hypothetical protein ABSH03_05090 [Candidatus Lustribacter sp.]
MIDNLKVKKIPTSAAIWDVSKFGQAKWGGGAGPVTVGDVLKGNPKDAEDALIAATASVEADVFVTNDGNLTNRVLACGSTLQVWDPARFIAYAKRP